MAKAKEQTITSKINLALSKAETAAVLIGNENLSKEQISHLATEMRIALEDARDQMNRLCDLVRQM